MKLSVMQENLARGLSVVSRAVSSRSTLPVLGNVLIRTEDGGLKLTATNLEIGITYWVPGKIDTDGAITVPAKLLASGYQFRHVSLAQALRDVLGPAGH